MEKRQQLRLISISFYIFFFSAFCQQFDDKVLGCYLVPNNIKDKVVEDYCIMFFANHRFKYTPMNNYLSGALESETAGFWSLHGDTIILDSKVKELTMESLGNFEYPFDNYTFKILELQKGSINWFDKCHSLRMFHFLTTNNDTLSLAPDENGMISISKKIPIACIWAESMYISNKVYMPDDGDLNFFIIKYSPYRQFVGEKWVLNANGTIIPIDRNTNQKGDYCLYRDIEWDSNKIWEDVVPPRLRMYKQRICNLRNGGAESDVE